MKKRNQMWKKNSKKRRMRRKKWKRNWQNWKLRRWLSSDGISSPFLFVYILYNLCLCVILYWEEECQFSCFTRQPVNLLDFVFLLKKMEFQLEASSIRKKKKLLKERRKQRERVALKMDLPGVSIADGGDSSMFSLSTINKQKVNAEETQLRGPRC